MTGFTDIDTSETHEPRSAEEAQRGDAASQRAAPAGQRWTMLQIKLTEPLLRLRHTKVPANRSPAKKLQIVSGPRALQSEHLVQ